MRNMLQLLGGVAVAGAVAAGSTAFTANGLTQTGAGTAAFVGGQVSQSVLGADLDSVDYVLDVTDANKLKSLNITFIGETNPVPDGSIVTVTATGGTTGPAPGALFYCSVTTSEQSTCTIGSASTNGTTKADSYITGLNSVSIKVVAA